MKKSLITILSLAALLIAPLASSADDAKPTIALMVAITSPTTKSDVPELIDIEGTVSDPQADVFVVVHPVKTQEYWVQQPATTDDKKWKASEIHIGQGEKGVGEKFEIRAFVGPKDNLQTGQKLKAWPQAAARSNVIEVKRT